MTRARPSNLGGARPGAGRKPKGRRRFTASLDPAIFEIIVQVNEKMQASSHQAVSLADTLNGILVRALQRHPLLDQASRNPHHQSVAR